MRGKYFNNKQMPFHKHHQPTDKELYNKFYEQGLKRSGNNEEYAKTYAYLQMKELQQRRGINNVIENAVSEDEDYAQEIGARPY